MFIKRNVIAIRKLRYKIPLRHCTGRTSDRTLDGKQGEEILNFSQTVDDIDDDDDELARHGRMGPEAAILSCD